MGKQYNVQVDNREAQKLSKVSASVGCLWGGEGSVPQLLRKLAAGTVIAVERHELDTLEPLIDYPIVRQLLQKLGIAVSSTPTDTSAIESALSRAIADKSPLLVWIGEGKYKVRYGEIAHRDDRAYLDCWIENWQERDPLDFPEPKALRHNRTFLISAIHRIARDEGARWREEGLDSIGVRYQIDALLVRQYWLKPWETPIATLSDGSLQVEAKISFWFWLWHQRLVAYLPYVLVLEPTDCRVLQESFLVKAIERFDDFWGNQNR